MAANAIPSTEANTNNRTGQAASRRWLKWLPTAFFLAAAVLLVVSISVPYW